MELHQLQYATQIAKYLSFTKAAAELCITQPTLSHQISKLESELGVILFYRKTRSVKLTLAGEAFVLHANRILSELGDLHHVMQEYKSFATGVIRIGIISIPGVPELTRHILSFREIYPGIHIRIIEVAGSFDLAEMLQAGSVDMAYLIPPPDREEEKICYYPLITGSAVLITGENHRLSGRKRISLSEAAEESFIFPPKSHSMHAIAVNACRACGFEPKIACECSQLSTVFNLVANGIGISFVSSQLVRSSLPYNVKAVQITPSMERTVCLAVLKELHQLPVIAAFLRFIFNEDRSLPPETLK